MALVNFTPASELQKQEEAKRQESEASKPQMNFSQLATFVRAQWDKARIAKQPIEEKMYKNLRMYRSEYDPEKLQAIRVLGGAETYLPIVNIKCRAAEAWINDIVFQPGELPWDIDPTPKPDLPPQIMEEIITRATQSASDMMNSAMMMAQQTGQLVDSNVMMSMLKDNMDKIKEEKEREIQNESRKQADATVKEVDDVFAEGGWYQALREVIHDIPILPSAILKGPVYQMSHEYSFSSGSLQVEDKIIQKYHRVNPLDIYPAPYSSDIEDGYIIERIRFSPKELSELKAVEGFDANAINRVLDFAKDKGWREWTTLDSSRVLTENKAIDALTNSDIIEGLEFWGAIKGELLLEWGLSGVDKDTYYEAAVWLINNEIIKAMLNPDPRQKKPYSRASFIEIPGAFWGLAVPDVLEHIQTGCNAVARASINNAAIASGPMVERNRDRVPGYESKAIAPWKVFDSTESQMSSNAPAYRFYQPAMNVDKLIIILDKFMKMADETSGIPAYAHGDLTVGGAGRALANYEPLVTSQGLVPMGSIKVNDQVLGSNGSFSTVTAVYPQGVRDIYRITFSNGETVDCDLNHLWSTKNHHDRKWQALTTKELMEKGLYRNDDSEKSVGIRPKWMLPKHEGVDFDKTEVRLDPYTMGAILGDGDSRCRITTMDDEIIQNIPYPLGEVSNYSNSKAASYSILNIRPIYNSYGLGSCSSITKFIPKEYLYNDRETRLELLRGLMDTDGCATSDGRTFFCSSSLQLLKDVKFLVNSLGGQTHRTISYDGIEDKEFPQGNYTTKPSHRFYFTLPNEQVFKLTRKQIKVKEIPVKYVYITDISLVGKYDTTCITVDAENSLYVCANFIVTHNTASGLQSLTANAARGIKDVVRNIDKGVIESSVERQYYFYLSTLTDFSEIPDSKIIAKGSTHIMKKEQDAMRKNEFLQAIFNPMGAQVLGADPLRYMVREVAKEHGVDDYELLDKAGANSVLMGGGVPMGIGGQPSASPPAPTPAEQNPAVSGQDINMNGSANGQ